MVPDFLSPLHTTMHSGRTCLNNVKQGFRETTTTSPCYATSEVLKRVLNCFDQPTAVYDELQQALGGAEGA